MTPDVLRDRGITRRCALLGAGGVGVAAVLTACSGGSSSDDPTAAGSTAASTADTPTSSAPSSAASSPAASSSAAGSGGASPAGDVIGSVSDVPVGGTASVEVDGVTVLLSQPEAGKIDAFSNVCPHQGGQVGPDGSQFLCSLHKSEFDLTGAVTRGPARQSLSAIAVAVSGDDIVKA